MSEPTGNVPQLCRFAESIVLPRIARVESDVTRRGADVDHAHHQIRVIHTKLQEILAAQSDADRRLTRLEKLVQEQTHETTHILRDISDIKVRVDNVSESTTAIQNAVSGIAESINRNHAARMRGIIWVGGLLGTVIAFAVMLHETITDITVITSLKALFGVIP